MDPDFGGVNLRCRRCGINLRASAKFCDGCGQPISSRREVGERKQVTVLFADVVGSMGLAAALDPERLREIMYDLFNRSAAVVLRYQGTVDKFTGDGLMAVFGAPTALEDHALRACVSALDIQSVVKALAAEVLSKDGVELRLRIGLNSGEVIVGDIGPGPGSYTAFGHPVGLAQRMEGAAAPGTILCSESTARIVERSARLGPVEHVIVKGVGGQISARRLVGIGSEYAVMGRDDGPMVGRDADLAALLNAFGNARVHVGTLVGEPGLGKSRLLREFAAEVAAAGADVVIARCESHTAQVPLFALSRFLRAMFSVGRLDVAAARAHVAAQLDGVVEPDSEDALIVFDLMSIGAGDLNAQKITANARRRRLIDVMSRVAKSRQSRSLFVVEDLHWVDEASSEVLVGFIEALAETRSFLVGSCRPEYHGRIREIADLTIDLAAMGSSATIALVEQILGRHQTTDGVAKRIAGMSAGNPFFVEEIVRDLVGRGFLVGNRGDYRLVGDLEAVAVPATIQSVLAARIDRLTFPEKAILNAAAVIGSKFDAQMLQVLIPGATTSLLQRLVATEFIDQMEFFPMSRYVFRHPLVREVSYASQLGAVRSDSHKRLAAAIEQRNPVAVEENSPLIAHHLDVAGDLESAYEWYLRAATWLRHRDMKGARASWERARLIADELEDDWADVTTKRTLPRAMLMLSAWQVGTAPTEGELEQLRRLTAESGDLTALAIGLSGKVTALVIDEGRPLAAAAMAAELSELIDEIDIKATEFGGMLVSVATAQYEAYDFDGVLRTTDRLRGLRPPAPLDDLSPAIAMAGAIKVMTGGHDDGWRDLRLALALGRESDPITHAIAVGLLADLLVAGFVVVDELILDESRSAVSQAEAFGDVYGLAVARWALGTALLSSGDAHDAAGMEYLRRSRAEGVDVGGSQVAADLAAEMARQGRRDQPIDALYATLLEEIDDGNTLFIGYPATELIKLLLARGTSTALTQAHDVLARLVAALDWVDEPAARLWPLHCRALLADAVGDSTDYTVTVGRYRALAEKLDARGHVATAKRLQLRPAVEVDVR
ncbi:MAG TPA: adenylate/guanylate cyclase domain-containing protein [Mycobacterium sp.]|nr:adenylate/guanylate cyclase domain-containing protein [Mycobacterium sp.]